MSNSPKKRRPGLHRHASRGLILINGEPVRKKARREYDKAKRNLDTARQEIEQFKAEDQPAFARWMNSTFGSDLTALRDLVHHREESARLIEEVERTSYIEGLGLGEAYRLVMHRRAHPEEAPSTQDSPPADEGSE